MKNVPILFWKRLRGLFLVVLFVLFFFQLPKTVLLYAQSSPTGGIAGSDLDTVQAREEFRIGVQAYYRFSYNEAIRSFERALSFWPGEPLILDWLGKSYYRSGIENTAFRVWQAAAEGYGISSGQGMLISSRMETLRNRRLLLPVADDEVRYVESGRYPGKNNEMVYFRQPTSVLALNDGSAWVVAYGSNEILRIDPNGIIRERKRGPLTVLTDLTIWLRVLKETFTFPNSGATGSPFFPRQETGSIT